MSWERRGNRRYYYRKRREGQQVFSEYVGTGQHAQDAADLDAALRHVRQLRRCQWASLLALDSQVDEACALIRVLTHAALLATGHHTHKGQWRKKRHV